MNSQSIKSWPIQIMPVSGQKGPHNFNGCDRTHSNGPMRAPWWAVDGSTCPCCCPSGANAWPQNSASNNGHTTLTTCKASSKGRGMPSSIVAAQMLVSNQGCPPSISGRIEENCSPLQAQPILEHRPQHLSSILENGPSRLQPENGDLVPVMNGTERT